jgi:hypothetical protein
MFQSNPTCSVPIEKNLLFQIATRLNKNFPFFFNRGSVTKRHVDCYLCIHIKILAIQFCIYSDKSLKIILEINDFLNEKKLMIFN